MVDFPGNAPARALSRRAFFRFRDQRAVEAARVPRLIHNCLESQGVACRACESACEPAAITFRPLGGGRAWLGIDAQKCSGCGACVAPCPVGALGLAPVAGEI